MQSLRRFVLYYFTINGLLSPICNHVCTYFPVVLCNDETGLNIFYGGFTRVNNLIRNRKVLKDLKGIPNSSDQLVFLWVWLYSCGCGCIPMGLAVFLEGYRQLAVLS